DRLEDPQRACENENVVPERVVDWAQTDWVRDQPESLLWGVVMNEAVSPSRLTKQVGLAVFPCRVQEGELSLARAGHAVFDKERVATERRQRTRAVEFEGGQGANICAGEEEGPGVMHADRSRPTRQRKLELGLEPDREQGLRSHCERSGKKHHFLTAARSQWAPAYRA